MEQWRKAHGRPPGEVLTLPQVWALSQLWYHDRLHPDFPGRSAAEAERIFQKLGLTSAFWRLEGDG